MSWKGRRVLVTGAGGFIGSHLAEALVGAGAEVRALCLYNSRNSRGWLDEVDPSVSGAIDVHLGDIRDASLVRDACRDVEVVFHLAALIAIPYSYRAPRSFFSTNVEGTLNVLEAVQTLGCRRLVQTSTSEVYGTPSVLPIKETHPLRGQSPYSASKIAADKACESFYCSFGTPVVTLRPFNTYGPRQSERAVIPTILAQLLAGKKQVKLGNIRPKRDLTFVSDTVAGFLAAGLAEGVEGKTVQLGTGVSVSIKEVFDAACQALSVEAEVLEDEQRVRPEGSEVMVLQSDPSLAEELMGWKAEVGLPQGLSRTAEWIEKNANLFGAEEYVI